ncbi:hypothetical protein SeMB42_g04700 [Synchytrium endobioticum]|uniref:Uncharacterized protein n=1 Tax=Synchytrium endobioticum TaxID=286115 RepID=A0A507CWD8_9FUNG|nr:hypothetical protein SeMB42_g04700 [Synchytrium endobioticum]
MLAYFILISLLLLQPFHADANEPTAAKLEEWRDAIRQFRSDHVNLETGELEETLLYRLVNAHKAFHEQHTREDRCKLGAMMGKKRESVTSLENDMLDGVVVDAMVPKGAPVTLEMLKNPADGLSQGLLEVYLECYETIEKVKGVFSDYLSSVGMWTRHDWHGKAQGECVRRLINNVFEEIVGPSTLEDLVPASLPRMLRMVIERKRITERFKELQTSDVSLLSPFTLRFLPLYGDIYKWCSDGSSIVLSEHAHQEISRPETLAYLINFNALVAGKLGLIKFAVSRFLDQEEHNMPSTEEEGYVDIQRVRERMLRLESLQQDYLATVEELKNALVPEFKNLMTRSVGTYLQRLTDSEQYGIPLDIAELAKKVFLLSIAYSATHDTVPDGEDEVTEQLMLCSSLHPAALSESNPDTGNNIASIDQSRSASNLGTDGRADMTSPSSSSGLRRVGSRKSSGYGASLPWNR